MSVRISILLPVFNGAHFLPDQLDSICSQSFTDFELVALDDGSTDNSFDILKSAAASDRRIQVERRQHNMGQNSALYNLLDKASASLIAFSDQDDLWHPDKLAILVASIGSKSLAFGRSPLIDENGHSLQRNLLDSSLSILSGQDNSIFLLRNSVSGHAMLVRRSIIEPYVFCLTRTYDWLIATIASFASGITYAPEAITYHRMHPNNQVNRLLYTSAEEPKRRKKRATRRDWRKRCNGLRDALLALAHAHSIPEKKRVIFRDLDDILTEQILYGGVMSRRSYNFHERWMEGLDRLELESAVQTEHAWFARSTLT